LGGWQITRKAGSLETVFKFHRSVKLDGGANVMVWSADIGATHEPPSNIVMKGQKWFVGDYMTTTLINIEGEVRVISICFYTFNFYIRIAPFNKSKVLQIQNENF
jgi:hypothetical protein